MLNTDIQFTISKVIITYDLSNNEISAQDIADASNGIFYIDIHTGNGKYKLPNTTLISDKNISVENAIKEFKKAFQKANTRKWWRSCSISRILAYDIGKQGGYIENNLV